MLATLVGTADKLRQTRVRRVKFRVNLGYTVSSRLAQVCKTQSQERTKPNVVTGLAQEPSFSIGQNLKKETVYFLNTGLH